MWFLVPQSTFRALDRHVVLAAPALKDGFKTLLLPGQPGGSGAERQPVTQGIEV